MASLVLDVDVPRRARGYNETDVTQSLRKRLSVPSVARSVGALLLDHAQLVAIPLMFAWCCPHAPTAAAALALPGLVLMGRAMRGLEALTHEASHHNLAGARRKRQNDLLGNAFAALPTFQSVQSYREVHLREHHGAFGTVQDPCAVRFLGGALGKLVRTSRRALLASATRQVFPSLRDWYSTIGTSRRVVAASLAWHGAYWSTAAALLPARYVFVAAAGWVIASSTVLPLLRLVGEADEHNYAQSTEFRATYTVTGFWHRFFFHPHGDGFHAEHHRYPRVPHHKLARLRAELLHADPTWRSAPTRSGLLWRDGSRP